ncbi:hypothetical protein EDC01DRAFT_590892, partial [Geopyxis carbonaria]
YKAKNPWPPDFSLLSSRDQFRLERIYRRRTALKWARPRLHQAVRLAQWAGAATTLGYVLFVAEWEGRWNVVMPIRRWVKDVKEGFWST